MTPTHPSRLQWPIGFAVLLAAAVPAFSGLGLDWDEAEIFTGLGRGWVIYFGLIHILILVFLGRRRYANILTIAGLVSLPVVFGGATLNWLGMVTGLTASDPVGSGIHYTRLCLTMLTVVPLALALVAVIPFTAFESRLLLRPAGIGAAQKKMLMILRIFNHTVFFVVPSLLEILREERTMVQCRPSSRARGAQFKAILLVLTHLAVEGICAAVQYIPLWAYEINQLPESAKGPKHARSWDSPKDEGH